jgi:hypothetical protein
MVQENLGVSFSNDITPNLVVHTFAIPCSISQLCRLMLV